MKKFISLLAALAMVSSLFVTTSFAAKVAPASAELTIDVAVADADQIADYEDNVDDVPAGYTLYALTLSQTGLGDWDNTNTVNKTAQFKKPTGWLPSAIQIDLDFGSDISKIYEDEENGFYYDSPYGLGIGINGNLLQIIFGPWSNTAAYPLNGGGTLTIEEGEEFATIYVLANDSATATYGSKTEITMCDYNLGNAQTLEGGDAKAAYGIGSGLTTNSASVVLSSGSPTIDVTGVSLDKNALNFKVGDAAQQLTATVAPDDATDKSVSWTSDNTSVATVSDGLVTAVGVGTATITVTTTDGSKTATCAVVVKAADVVIPSAETVAAVDKDNITKTYTDLQGKPVTSFSKNYGIAKFSTALDTAAKNYFIDVTDTDGNDKTFAVNFAEVGVELSSTSDFYAIVKSATHVIKTIALRAVAK